MLFLRAAQQVRGVAQLRLDLLLAIAVVVVGDQRDNDALCRSARSLEGLAIVVEVALVAPAHTVAFLPFGRFRHMGQSDLPLRDALQVGSQDHCARVPAPPLHIQSRVVFRKERISRVPEDGLDEIQIRHQASRREEPRLHPQFVREAGHARRDEWSKQERDDATSVRIEGQAANVVGRVETDSQQFRERALGHRSLVRRNRQSAFGDMKRALRRATVVARVMQHAVRNAMGADIRGFEHIPVFREGKFPGHPMAVNHKSPPWEPLPTVRFHVLEVCREELFDALIRSAAMVDQQSGLLAVAIQQPFRRTGDFRISGSQSRSCEAQTHVLAHHALVFGSVRRAGCRTKTEGSLQVHLLPIPPQATGSRHGRLRLAFDTDTRHRCRWIE